MKTIIHNRLKINSNFSFELSIFVLVKIRKKMITDRLKALPVRIKYEFSKKFRNLRVVAEAETQNFVI